MAIRTFMHFTLRTPQEDTYFFTPYQSTSNFSIHTYTQVHSDIVLCDENISIHTMASEYDGFLYKGLLNICMKIIELYVIYLSGLLSM